MTDLLSSYQLTDELRLKNRIIMAPMTRCMANDDLSITDDMVKYYVKRSDAGLIITEGTIIRRDGLGFNNVPGIYTQKQIDSWAKLTSAIHEKGGKIFCQLWHVGRVSHPNFLDGELPLAPSATTMSGRIKRTKDLYYGDSRQMSLADIKQLIDDFTQAAINAMKAGFDGVEFHGANGYLIDQFMHYATNQRDDQYGGSIENMARFALDIIESAGQAIGYSKVAIRLSPAAYLNEIKEDVKDAKVFEYLLKQLNKKNIAYVHTGNFDDSVIFESLGNLTMTDFMRQFYQGKLIACGGYDLAKASQAVEEEKFDCVAIGRPFIANPDLINKLKNKEILEAYDMAMLATLD